MTLRTLSARPIAADSADWFGDAAFNERSPSQAGIAELRGSAPDYVAKEGWLKEFGFEQ